MRPKEIELLELVGEYCDKTLSEGCWIRVKFSCYQQIKIIDWENSYIRNGKNIQKVDINKLNLENEFIEEKWIKIYRNTILGHLGMTSVLKYVNKNHKIALNYNWETIQVLDYENNILWEIPNKELYLYTDEELDNLICNLKEIWKLPNIN